MRFRFGRSTAIATILMATFFMFTASVAAQDDDRTVCVDFFGFGIGDSWGAAVNDAMLDVLEQAEGDAQPWCSSITSVEILDVEVTETADGTFEAVVLVEVCYYIWGVPFCDLGHPPRDSDR